MNRSIHEILQGKRKYLQGKNKPTWIKQCHHWLTLNLSSLIWCCTFWKPLIFHPITCTNVFGSIRRAIHWNKTTHNCCESKQKIKNRFKKKKCNESYKLDNVNRKVTEVKWAQSIEQKTMNRESHKESAEDEKKHQGRGNKTKYICHNKTLHDSNAQNSPRNFATCLKKTTIPDVILRHCLSISSPFYTYVNATE